MLICKPLKDEFARGHVGRFRILNHIPSLLQTSASIRKEVKNQKLPPQNQSLAASVACICNMTLNEYLGSHTLMPLRLLNHAKTETNRKCNWSPRELALFGMASLRSDAYFCERCTRYEEETFGYSYWHRSHQIPGVHKCGKHKGQFLTCISNKDAFLKLPSSWISNEAPSLACESLPSYGHGGLERLIALQEAILCRSEIFDIAVVNSSLNYQATLMGIGADPSGKFKPLSKFASETFSAEFLAQYFKKEYSSYNERFIASKIDSVLNSNSQMTGTKEKILAASLLYTSVEHVLQCWRLPSLIDDSYCSKIQYEEAFNSGEALYEIDRGQNILNNQEENALV